MVKPIHDFWSLFVLLGTVQGFFLTINCFLIARKGPAIHALLGWLLLSVCLTVLEVWLCYSNAIAQVPYWVGVSEPFNFVFPPLLYFYSLALTKPNFQWRAQFNWAFVPALLHAVYLIPFYGQTNDLLLQTVAVAYHRPSRMDAEFRNLWWASTYKPFYQGFKCLLVSYQVGYLLLTLWALRKATSKSDSTRVSIQWVSQISWSFLLILTGYGLLTWYYQSDVGGIYIATCVSVVFFGMSLRLITQSKILTQPVSNQAVTVLERVKYEKTALSEEASLQTRTRLLSYMEQEKPYRRSDLTLLQLATQLGTASHHLSQVINHHCKQNFFDFINTYRVEEIRHKLISPQYSHLKIEEIAYESGFQSKSAFNAAFKKMTHQTPSQYRKLTMNR